MGFLTLPRIQISSNDGELCKNLTSLSRQENASPNRRFKFKKRRQLFIRVHNEALTVAAMRVSNPDGSPVGINRCHTTPTPPSFAEIVSDYLPVLHAQGVLTIEILRRKENFACVRKSACDLTGEDGGLHQLTRRVK
jgi:hypothetical protein